MKKSAYLLILTIIVSAVMMSFAAASSASEMYGDLDRDGTLTSADVRAVLRYMVGERSLTAEEFRIADHDGNKRVDTLDGRYILQVITLDQTPSAMATTTTTVATTTTTKPSLDDEGYYDEIVRP